jgi:hypothetical protein
MPKPEVKRLRKYNGSRNPDGRPSLPPEKVKQKVTVYLAPELIEFYKVLADTERRTLSQMLGVVLEDYASQVKPTLTEEPTGD